MITGFGDVPFKPLAIGGGVDLMRDWQRESRVTVVPIPGSNTSDTVISGLGPPLLTLPVETPTQADYQALQLRLLSVGTLTVATSQGAQHRCPRPGRITRIDARARTAPTGQSLNVRITRNGVMLATLAIAAGQTLATWSDGADVEAGDWLAVDITQIGSGTAGANLSVQMEEMVRA
jgi:hypothetical protein